MASEVIPRIDISCYFQAPPPEDPSFPSASQREVSAQLDHAFRSVGFVLLKGLPIDPDLVKQMMQCGKEMFDKAPEDKERDLAPLTRPEHVGYVGIAGEVLNSNRKADLKEVSLPSHLAPCLRVNLACWIL